MGVEDHFQVTLVESQVQNDFIFSSARRVHEKQCLLVFSLPRLLPATPSSALSCEWDQTKKQQVSEKLLYMAARQYQLHLAQLLLPL